MNIKYAAMHDNLSYRAFVFKVFYTIPMKIIPLFLALFTTSLWAAEVAIIQKTPNSKEVQLTFTEEALPQALDKHFMLQTCKVRLVTSTVREYYIPTVCRAELMKFLLNNDYKPLSVSTFYK